jgi:hypothetical protein
MSEDRTARANCKMLEDRIASLEEKHNDLCHTTDCVMHCVKELSKPTEPTNKNEYWNVKSSLENCEVDIRKGETLFDDKGYIHLDGYSVKPLPSKADVKYKCKLCGRDKFDSKQPHNCIGGYRKSGLVWEELSKPEKAECEHEHEYEYRNCDDGKKWQHYLYSGLCCKKCGKRMPSEFIQIRRADAEDWIKFGCDGEFEDAVKKALKEQQ